MSVKMRDNLPLERVEEFEAWVEVFEAKARTKNITDTDEKKALTDEFLGYIGVKELMKVTQLVAPKNVPGRM